MNQKTKKTSRLAGGRAAALLGLVAVVLAGSTSFLASAGGAPSLSISQDPLQLATPVHPQVLLAIANSQSMDGNLSGAIMVGSGSLGATMSGLNTSSSPLNYTVPAGFTPPVTAADGSGKAPYTATVNGDLVDNGDSRLNVAKGGVAAILSTYMQNTDFALADYSTSNSSVYTTWVYYMSVDGGFTFTNTPVAKVDDTAAFTVANPCFGYLATASATVKSNCTAMVPTLYSAATLNLNAYMLVKASSDNANVNDVLYAFTEPAVFVNYDFAGLSSSSLNNYNSGNVRSTYRSSLPNANKVTGPTNAGYVPQSEQVMYVRRGFGYGGSQSASSGNVAVPMTTAGVAPTAASVAAAIAKFTPLLQPETNDAATTEIKAAAGQAAFAGLLSKAKTYLASVKATGACPPPQYVVLISDGLPTMDLDGKAWPPLGSSAAATYGVTATFNADGSLTPTAAFTNDVALTDTITALAALKTAGINTYILGLGAGVDPTLNPAAAATLKAMAMAGGTNVAYPATSPEALASALSSILTSIQAGSLSTTQSAVNSTILKTDTVQYQASFTSNDTPYQDWTGDLRKTALDPATGLPTGPALWSAQTLLDTAVSGSGWSSTRNMVTWNPTLNSGAGGGTPFLWANLSAAQTTQLGSAATLQYLRGDQSAEQHNGGAFRNRSHTLGDMVNSAPLYVGPPNAPYFSSSYFSFVTAKKARAAMLYVGANDGMLHAFVEATGQEQFAFVPNAVFSKLSKLTAPLYNQGHQFFVDGSPTTGDVQFSDDTWHTVLLGGENAGGQSIYALDITNPSTLTTQAAVSGAVLWEFTDTNMGFSYSVPQLARVKATSRFAAFFGNGYNSSSQKPWLFAVNPETGAKLAGIDLCAAVVATLPTACDSSLPNGLSSVSFNSDALLGTAVTQVYAGDLQGNMWAIDVSNASPSAWTVRLLFQARDTDTGRTQHQQAITTPAVVTLNPNYPRQAGDLVMFGTGQFLGTPDLSTTQTQTAYGLLDKGGVTPYTRANLQSQTLSLVTKATSGLPKDILTVTSQTVDFTTKGGWYVDLISSGQRFMTKPTGLKDRFVATLNTPPASACSAVPSSMLLELNYATGGAFTYPILDSNGNGVINIGDPVAAGVSIGPGYASSPTILNPSGSGSGSYIRKQITLSGGQQQSIKNTTSAGRTTSWWQIQ
jgi:type IV pilus assembly protein PilY1